MSTKQYVVSKYVMATSAQDAVNKSRRMPIHEVYVSSGWFEKAANNTFYPPKEPKAGYKDATDTSARRNHK